MKDKKPLQVQLFQWQYNNMLQILPNPERWLSANNQPRCVLHIPQRPNPMAVIDESREGIWNDRVSVIELSFHINRDSMLMYWEPDVEIVIINDHLSKKMGRG